MISLIASIDTLERVVFFCVAAELVVVAARLHSHNSSAVLIVKLHTRLFVQAVLNDIVVGNVVDMLLGRVDFESPEFLVVLDILVELDIPVVLDVRVLLDILLAVDSAVALLLVSLFLLSSTYSR